MVVGCCMVVGLDKQRLNLKYSEQKPVRDGDCCRPVRGDTVIHRQGSVRATRPAHEAQSDVAPLGMNPAPEYAASLLRRHGLHHPIEMY